MIGTAERPPGSRQGPAYLLAVGAGVLWGTAGPFSVGLVRAGLSPESVAILRPLLGSAALAALLLHPAWRGPRLGFRGLLLLAGGGGILVGLFQMAYQQSTAALGVASTVALLYLFPALVLALSGPLLREWPSPARVAMGCLSVLGVWIAVVGASGGVRFTPSGLAWGLLTGASFGGYTLLGRHAAPHFGALPTLVWSTAGGTLLLAGAYVAAGTPVSLPGEAWGWVLLILFTLTTIPAASLLYFGALARIDAGRAAVGATVEPLVGTLLAWLLLAQAVGPVTWVGLLVLVTGVAGTYLVGRRPGAAVNPVESPPPPHPLPRPGSGGGSHHRGPTPPAGRG